MLRPDVVDLDSTESSELRAVVQGSKPTKALICRCISFFVVAVIIRDDRKVVWWAGSGRSVAMLVRASDRSRPLYR